MSEKCFGGKLGRRSEESWLPSILVAVGRWFVRYLLSVIDHHRDQYPQRHEYPIAGRVSRAFRSVVGTILAYDCGLQHSNSHPSREDLEQLLEDPTYFQAIFHSLKRVMDLYNQQAELGLANESIASKILISTPRR